jgi:ribonuclease-3
MEALFGAIFLDGGFERARLTIARLYHPILETVDPQTLGKDAKTLLQEYLQGRKIALPTYNVVATHGAAHNQEFEVECLIPKLEIRVTGAGASRRAAEQAAAKKALELAPKEAPKKTKRARKETPKEAEKEAAKEILKEATKEGAPEAVRDGKESAAREGRETVREDEVRRVRLELVKEPAKETGPGEDAAPAKVADIAVAGADPAAPLKLPVKGNSR